MKYPGMRRFLLAAAAASSVLLASCGGGSVVDALVPGRIVVIGDAFSDVGQAGNRYTVNDGSVNNWTLEVAAQYNLPLTAASAGGTGYAQGNARITLKPDAGGGTTTRTIDEQVTAFLATGTPGAKDLVVIGGGFSDIIAQVVNTAQSADQRRANAQQAGRDLATQVRRLVNAGAKYVVLTGVYDLGNTPWGTAIGQRDVLGNLSQAFNDSLKTALVDLGNSVLYLDAANFFNNMTNQPGNFDLDSSKVVACTATASGTDGIGISAGAHVSSRVCTASTIAAGVDFNRTLYADSVYPTPRAHRLFGDSAFSQIRNRF